MHILFLISKKDMKSVFLKPGYAEGCNGNTLGPEGIVCVSQYREDCRCQWQAQPTEPSKLNWERPRTQAGDIMVQWAVLLEPCGESCCSWDAERGSLEVISIRPCSLPSLTHTYWSQRNTSQSGGKRQTGKRNLSSMWRFRGCCRQAGSGGYTLVSSSYLAFCCFPP